MKVTRDTPDQLIVEDRPWILGAILIAFTMVFAVIGMAMLADGEAAGLGILGGALIGLLGFAVLVQRLQVIFHRPENYIEIRRKSVFRQSAIRYPLSECAAARLEETAGDESMLYRVSLDFPSGQSQGRHALTHYYSNSRGHARCETAINAWLAQSRPAPGPERAAS